jgi:Uncharacterized stress protein (general stress protein 26)
MNEKIIARAEEIIASTRYCTLSLIDADGYPTTAAISPSKVEGVKWIAFGNSVESNWVKRAENCNRAGICFSSDSPECNITLVGTIEVLKTDIALKKEMWSDWMNEYYSGVEDPRYCVLKFTTKRYSLFIDGTQVRGIL